MTNPTTGTDKSDANGWFPQVFMAEAVTVDILLKDAAGVTLASYVNVISLGSDTGSLVRDFTNSRFSARGSGGTVYLEAGDPTGDDVGGTGVLGGWNGTQADSWAINAALVNVIGRFKENSKKLPSITYADLTTAAAAAFVALPLPNDPTGIRMWEYDLFDIVLSAASANITAVLSYDAGASYKTGAADYAYGNLWNNLTVPSSSADDADTAMLLGTGVKTPANIPAFMTLNIVTPNSGANATQVWGQITGYDNNSTATPRTQAFGAFGLGGYGRATHIKLVPSSGTIALASRLQTHRGTGDT
jgi:hypothetical protein